MQLPDYGIKSEIHINVFPNKMKTQEINKRHLQNDEVQELWNIEVFAMFIVFGLKNKAYL